MDSSDKNFADDLFEESPPAEAPTNEDVLTGSSFLPEPISMPALNDFDLALDMLPDTSFDFNPQSDEFPIGEAPMTSEETRPAATSTLTPAAAQETFLSAPFDLDAELGFNPSWMSNNNDPFFNMGEQSVFDPSTGSNPTAQANASTQDSGLDGGLFVETFSDIEDFTVDPPTPLQGTTPAVPASQAFHQVSSLTPTVEDNSVTGDAYSNLTAFNASYSGNGMSSSAGFFQPSTSTYTPYLGGPSSGQGYGQQFQPSASAYNPYLGGTPSGQGYGQPPQPSSIYPDRGLRGELSPQAAQFPSSSSTDPSPSGATSQQQQPRGRRRRRRRQQSPLTPARIEEIRRGARERKRRSRRNQRDRDAQRQLLASGQQDGQGSGNADPQSSSDGHSPAAPTTPPRLSRLRPRPRGDQNQSQNQNPDRRPRQNAPTSTRSSQRHARIIDASTAEIVNPRPRNSRAPGGRDTYRVTSDGLTLGYFREIFRPRIFEDADLLPARRSDRRR